MPVNRKTDRQEERRRGTAGEPEPAPSGTVGGHMGLAALAHDLRNPLDVIEFSAEHLLEARRGNAQTRARMLHTILRSVHDARRMTDELLDVASGDPRTFSVQPSWTPARQLLLAAESIGRPIADEASLTFAIEHDDALPLVWADPRRITRVFANLIGNAAKFTPPGGRITVRAACGHRHVQFSVADTGPGIDAQDRARVFGPFCQLHEGDDRGRGLGLSICRRIVEAHKGHLWVEHGATCGAVLAFTLVTLGSYDLEGAAASS